MSFESFEKISQAPKEKPKEEVLEEQNLFEKEIWEIRQEVKEKREKNKFVSLKEIEEKLKKLSTSVHEEKEANQLASSLKNWFENLRYKDPLLVQGLVKISDEIFNHRWPIEKISEEFLKKKEGLPRPTAKVLWEESLKSSQALDKLLGRKLAKRLRRGVKKGEAPQDLIKKEKNFLEEKGISLSQTENLLYDYDAHYKSWRDFIEKEVEKEIEESRTYQTLLKMWRNQEISKEGLRELSRVDESIKNLASAIFGNYMESEAAKRLLQDIEARRVKFFK